MNKVSAEQAAGEMATLRRRYLNYYRRVAKGERTGTLRRQIREARASLSMLLARLDCPPRPLWTKLLIHFQSLEKKAAKASASSSSASHTER
jgi:hypothetical protein